MTHSIAGKSLLRRIGITALFAFYCSAPLFAANRWSAMPQSNDHAASTPSAPTGVPFAAEKLAALLPATVYFQGRSAALQLRNAAGTTFGTDAIVWASLVDTSGYSTSVQERYQFYLVTEAPLRLGDVHLPAGAYGAGFIGDKFLLMDLGGRTISEGPTQMDEALRRPRPLQMVADGVTSVKLYLGRRWVTLQADPAQSRGK